MLQVSSMLFLIVLITHFTRTQPRDELGNWIWLSNETTVDSSRGKSPWAPGEPSGTYQPYRRANCATRYGKYNSYLGRFDDVSCRRLQKDTGHICERAVSCIKDDRGRSLFVEQDQKHAFSVFFLINQLSNLWY